MIAGEKFEFRSAAQVRAMADVLAERRRQEEKWGKNTCANPSMIPGEALAVLTEELGEVATEVLGFYADEEGSKPRLRTELSHVAAVALAWMEALE